MKIKMEDEKIVLYLYNYFFKSNDKDIIVKEIKELFLKLIKIYHIKISGIYEVLLYENLKYGTILEIIKKEELLFSKDLIDIKVKIIKNIDIYLKTKDYFILSKYKNIYYFNNYFYININNIDSLINLLEFVEIIYKEKDICFNNMLYIK